MLHKPGDDVAALLPHIQCLHVTETADRWGLPTCCFCSLGVVVAVHVRCVGGRGWVWAHSGSPPTALCNPMQVLQQA